MEFKSLDEIGTVKVHWSENIVIEDNLETDKNGDIEKFVDVIQLDKLISKGSGYVKLWYDKICLSVWHVDDRKIYDNEKFYLTKGKDSLIKLINS